jgi:hypothetical protein
MLLSLLWLLWGVDKIGNRFSLVRYTTSAVRAMAFPPFLFLQVHDNGDAYDQHALYAADSMAMSNLFKINLDLIDKMMPI